MLPHSSPTGAAGTRAAHVAFGGYPQALHRIPGGSDLGAKGGVMNQVQSAFDPSGDLEYWELRLYVAGQTDKSIRAVNNLNASLQRASRWPLFDRGDRSSAAPPACGRRPDSRGTDARAAAAGADQENHRRPLERGTPACGPRYSPAEGVI